MMDRQSVSHGLQKGTVQQHLLETLVDEQITSCIAQVASATARQIGDEAAKMQNRTNRNLLFGGRSGPAAGDAGTEAFEADNQRGIDRLGGSAGAIKDIAIAIEADVSDQNRMLDGVDKRFESANGLVASTLESLKDLVNDRTGTRMTTLIAAAFAMFVVLYLLIRKS